MMKNLSLLALMSLSCYAQDTPYDQYGGIKTIRARATGFFRLGRHEGRHYLFTPEGHAYRALGINHFHNSDIPDPDGVIEQLKGWGFNAGCYQGPKWMWRRFPYTQGITLTPTCHFYSEDRFRFVDVFDPDFLAGMEKTIRDTVVPQAENKMLIGYFWTDIPVWHRDKFGSNWISFFKGLEPGTPGRKAWDRWRAAHPEASAQDFLPVIAHQIYSHAYRTLRKYDANHLIFGERYHQWDYVEAVAKEALPYIDAVAVQPSSHFSREYYDKLYATLNKPVYIADHVSSFATPEHTKTMGQVAANEADYARFYEDYVTQAFALPYLIGYNKCKYQDEAKRGTLKQGIIQINGKPYNVIQDISRANKKVLQATYKSPAPRPAANHPTRYTDTR